MSHESHNEIRPKKGGRSTYLSLEEVDGLRKKSQGVTQSKWETSKGDVKHTLRWEKWTD
jgi:hypothetical protein